MTVSSTLQVDSFKTTWGISEEDLEAWIRDVKAKGYSGIEYNPANYSKATHQRVRELVHELGLDINIQIFSSWINYIGPRPMDLHPVDHLKVYREQLQIAKTFSPVVINVQGGCDVWTVEQSIEFYKGTIRVDDELDLSGVVCHETHRNRSCFTPSVTVRIVREVPELRLTADISHWVVVSERLLDIGEEDNALLEEVLPHFHHLHCRIGTVNSSQCHEPEHEFYAPERAFFYKYWAKIVQHHRRKGTKLRIGFVPEYGPFPYHSPFAPRSNSEIADSEHVLLHELFNSGK